MKHPTLFIAWMSALLVGCQSFPQPAPGLASIRIHVVAEPKAGYVSPDGTSVYDSPGERQPGTGAFQRVDYATLDEIIVWIEPTSATAIMEASPNVIDVAAKKPALTITRGVSVNQRLIVHNLGAAPANFYSVSDGNEFDLGLIPNGGQKEYTVRSAGLIEILNDASVDPVAKIYAAPSRWVAMGQAGSEVDFINLPTGRYKIASWHPRLPGSEVFVTLSPDQVAISTIKVGVNTLPKIGPR